MDKKYQVFVSSTYMDLVEERKEVIQALLELDCIPVGMELFPASDESQWSFIQSVIDDCDYYILILAGRYGSCTDDGIGYTEMEYRYALQTGKPIISFIHDEPQSIPLKNTDNDPVKTEKLKLFRELVQKKLCKSWRTPHELGGVVGRSIVQLKKRSPAVGWVKADLVPTESAAKEMLKLKNRIEELEAQLKEASQTNPVNVESLSKGDDYFELDYKFVAKEEGILLFLCPVYHSSIKLTWNDFFSILSPQMVDEASEDVLKERLAEYIKDNESERIYQENEEIRETDLRAFSVLKHSFETLVIQFRALGLIKRSEKGRSVKDKATYWSLTPLGDELMINLRAVKN